MTLPRFEYHAPSSLEEALLLLGEKGAGARVLAGGTDLMVKMRHGMLNPGALIAIKGIAGLDGISFDSRKGLTIGATALLADVASNTKIRRKYPAVSDAARETANVQIRNMGTLVGNLCNAAPSADNAPVLLALSAEVVLQSLQGKRRLPLAQFFTGPGVTAMEPEEILTSVFVPLPPPHSGASYQHLSARGKVDIAAVGVAAMVTMNGNRCEKARIFLGAVAPIPMRATKTERVVEGKALTPKVLAETGRQAAREARPITDVRAGAAYRRQMTAVLTRRALTKARQRALQDA